MAKRSDNDLLNERVEELEEIDTVLEEAEATSTVKLALRRDIVLRYNGKVTGQLYVFNRAGSTQDVDVRDVDEMMSKKIGGCPGCPANSGPQPYFEIIE